MLRVRVKVRYVQFSRTEGSGLEPWSRTQLGSGWRGGWLRHRLRHRLRLKLRLMLEGEWLDQRRLRHRLRLA